MGIEMAIEMAIVLVGLLMGSIGVIEGLKKCLMSHKEKKTIKLELENGRKFEIDTTNIPYQDIQRLLLRLTETEYTSKKQLKISNESGNITMGALQTLIPGMIAVLIVVVYVYKIVQMEEVPESLVTIMMTVTGYLFGRGTSNPDSKRIVVSS